jgi:eukaryotic-like serine/threonine-protein kinase
MSELEDSIGPYKPIKVIATGGMGRIYLCEDPIFKRKIALKRIRKELASYQVIRDRFIQEAKIASRLFHPSIIPIYNIYEEKDDLFYTMPYIEGRNFKELLKAVKAKESGYQDFGSLASLMRIFLQLCQVICYCHSQGIIHRDVKPENVIIGEFGQVFLVDWGLATYVNQETKEIDLPSLDHKLTRPGKVVGTLSYMPPERLDEMQAHEHLDLYALGVILYQLLTLKMPFHRSSLEQFKKTREIEELLDLLEAAPYREIPAKLALASKKCLAKKKSMRYKSVSCLMQDIQSYIDGNSDWIYKNSLNIDTKGDWRFQEYIPFRQPLESEDKGMPWVHMMMAKKGLSGHLRFEINATIKKNFEGVGVLFCSPDKTHNLEEGYCVWISKKKGLKIRLFRYFVLLHEISVPDVDTFDICIEKTGHTIRLFFEHKLIIEYTDPLPIVGNNIGLLAKNLHFSFSKCDLFTQSPQASISCLSIPDAFFATKQFDHALDEYQKIAESFNGQQEGRQAIFRSSLALQEKAKACSCPKQKKALINDSFEILKCLEKTAAEPLSYVAKALGLCYLRQDSEEMKTLEIALRKHKSHPMIKIVEEHCLLSFHQSLYKRRFALFNLAYILSYHLPHTLLRPDLKLHLDKLVDTDYTFYPINSKDDLATYFAFMLGKDRILDEINTPLAHQLKSSLTHSTKIVSKKEKLELLSYIQENLLPSRFSSLDKQIRQLESTRSIPIEIKADLLAQYYLYTKNFKKVLALLEHTKAKHFYEGCLKAALQGESDALSYFQSLHLPSNLKRHNLAITHILDKKDLELVYVEKIARAKHMCLYYHTLNSNKAQTLERQLQEKSI